MDKIDTINNIKNTLQLILDEFNAELVDINIKSTSSGELIQILADKEGGITVGECATINRRLGDALDKEDIMPGKYVLEVSSPGLDRPLENKRDFERVAGETVQVTVSEPIEEKSFFEGQVGEINDEFVLILAKKDKIFKLAYDNIKKAKLKIEF